MLNKNDIFNIKSESDFTEIALEIFKIQYKHCPIYKKYCNILDINPNQINNIQEIPFLPIETFKYNPVITDWENNKSDQSITFSSSGTTGMVRSFNHIPDVEIYKKSFRKTFSIFYGDINQYCILALLPSYLEREGSSLVYMVEDMIKESKHPESNFYLYNTEELLKTIEKLKQTNTKTILFGVTFALLDFAGTYNPKLNENFIVMETGGMKGRGKELIKEELYSILQKSFNLSEIHSEYGMCELLSQAYSKGKGIFNTPPWMKILIRDSEDPLTILNSNSRGGINIIDLANINTCSFIATQDLGIQYPNGSFQVLGRFDASDVRGCSLLIADS